ncbi:MAG TPA: glucose-6-phosphate isomerase [Casimicrobiaceae bacterium]|nr:glucose-6-phosphate isomerase [Casimicrobiaceae bacterium]
MTGPASTDPSQALIDQRRTLAGRSLLDLFAADDRRAAKLSLAWEDWLADWSKQRLTPETMRALLAFARSRNLEMWIAALFAGEKVNLSEQRPALHTALRQTGDAPLRVDGEDVMPAIRATQARVRTLATQLRGGLRLGVTGRPIRSVVHLGIGGSDLGPALVCDALMPTSRREAVDVAFVSNVDPEHLTRALAGLDPAMTLFIVTSKTFTTLETLRNAQAAREWLAAGLGRGAALSPHFVAVTANVEAARAFGVGGADVLPMWDWVGGRYSLWSAVGISIAVRCGWDAFAALLAGAASMDAHLKSTPLETNLPVLLALVDYWNAELLGEPQRIVVPYAHALRLLPSWLQQLSLESNGKSIARDGSALAGRGAPAVWGGVGTDSQHAFFQWLHQGTHPVPVEFVVPVRAAHPLGDQQSLLVANALAQAQALLVGKPLATVRTELAAKGVAPAAIDTQAPHRVCPGDRPSTTLLLPELNARRLGQLLALYEHRTFVEGVLTGVNSFDQWGVELGKGLAAPIAEALRRGGEPDGADASTSALAAHAYALSRARGSGER